MKTMQYADEPCSLALARKLQAEEEEAAWAATGGATARSDGGSGCGGGGGGGQDRPRVTRLFARFKQGSGFITVVCAWYTIRVHVLCAVECCCCGC